MSKLILPGQHDADMSELATEYGDNLRNWLTAQSKQLQEATLEITSNLTQLDSELQGGKWQQIGALSWGDRAETLAYRTVGELEKIRNTSRNLALRNPFAINIIENGKSYIVGTGHTTKAVSKPGKNAPEALLKKAQQEIDDFLKANRWPVRQEEYWERRERDGEVLRRFFELPHTFPDGRKVDPILKVRFVEPEQLVPPSEKGQLSLGRTGHGVQDQTVYQSAPFGIAFLRISDGKETFTDYETPTTYFIRSLSGATGDLYRSGSYKTDPLLADEIQHTKANVDLSAPRGIPTLWAIEENLNRACKNLRNVSEVVGIQAAIAMVRKHSRSTQATIQQYVSNMADVKYTSSLTDKTKTYKEYPPGAILDVPDGVEYQFPGIAVPVDRAVASVQAELRAAAARVQYPEFMLSSDACFCEETQILTATGWASIGSLTRLSIIATVHPETHQIMYQKAKRVYETYRTGQMVHMQNKCMDTLVTPNHEMYWGDRKWKRVEWTKRHAVELLDPPTVMAKFMACPKPTHGSVTPETPFDGSVDKELIWTFLGIFVGDGSTTEKGSRSCVGGITRPRKLETFEPILSELADFSLCVASDGRYHWFSDSKAIHDYLREAVGTSSEFKHLPEGFRDLPLNLKEALLTGLIESDGYRSTETSALYSTTSSRLADEVQELVLLVGKNASISKQPPGHLGTLDVYRVNISAGNHRLVDVRNVVSIEAYSGNVWCVEVPNGLIISRRNGKVLITGNSNSNYSSTMVAEGPAVKKFDRMQNRIIEADYEVYIRAIRVAVDAGRLPKNTLDLVDLETKGPIVATRNMPEEVSVLSTSVENKWIAPQTASQRLGYDPVKEAELWKEWDKDHPAPDKTPDKPKPGEGSSSGQTAEGPSSSSGIESEGSTPSPPEKIAQRKKS